MTTKGPIGVFDSGYGGLTVLKELVNVLPHYNFMYLGDNARTPYGTRSFQTVYHYTLQCVEWFFSQGCPLVIIACNTASAKALRSIQQNDLERLGKENRVLGVIRPTTERLAEFTTTGKVGILGTNGTVQSNSYQIELSKFHPGIQVYQHACPMWVPLVENNEWDNEGADYFIKKDLEKLFSQAEDIDTVLLACTHYPLLKNNIEKYLPAGKKLITQGEIVAASLEDYLLRHPELEARCSKGGTVEFYTTDSTEDFDNHGTLFFGQEVQSQHVDLDVPCSGA